jgi:outer membrane protein assembly factor BamD
MRKLYYSIMKRILPCFLVLLLALTGCGLFAPKEEKTAAELAAEGRRAFEKENYRQAMEAYSKIRDWYPFSRYAKEAELRVADAHYRLDEYEQAISAYEQFERLHPSDSKIPHVIYQIGRCYFDRMKGVDRDQTYTQKALKVFRQLNTRFPDSEYAQEAKSHIRKCLRTLAGHDFYVGEFYFKQQHYKAALERFRNVVENYPADFAELRSKALNYIEQCRDKLQARAGAESAG